MDTQVEVKEATLDRLERLGFKKASAAVKLKKAKAKKLMIAYENYRYVRPEKIKAFNEKLAKKTYNWDGMMGYHTLELVPISDYEGVPPTEVLDALQTAKDRECFDTFEVAYIKKVKDPLLFGRVTGCPDRFFISHWDEDVKITDLLKDNEG